MCRASWCWVSGTGKGYLSGGVFTAAFRSQFRMVTYQLKAIGICLSRQATQGEVLSYIPRKKMAFTPPTGTKTITASRSSVYPGEREICASILPFECWAAWDWIANLLPPRIGFSGTCSERFGGLKPQLRERSPYLMSRLSFLISLNSIRECWRLTSP